MRSLQSTIAITTPFKQVEEFHTTFGHPVKKDIQNNIFDLNPNIVKFRLDLINEEIKELKEAFYKTDYIEFVDALGDILYVIFGMCHVFGINYDELFPGINNSIKIIESKKKTNDFDFNKYFISIKNDIEITVDIEIDKLNNLLKYSCEEKNMNNVIMYINYIVTLIIQLSDYLNISIIEAFTEIHRSNMTKVCSNIEDAISTVKWYKDNETRYATPDYKKSPNEKYWIIYDVNTTKILKSKFFEPPKLEQFIGIKVKLNILK
jgi:predicted HAD superfamily Cof-like phosphohydrolase